MDSRFTDKIISFLETPVESREIEAGAKLLLQMNGNRMLYQNIIRRRNNDKLEYELRKHLKYRLDGLTLQEVHHMNTTVVPAANTTIAEAAHRGKRADHDQLPESIRQIYEENGETYKKLKQVFYALSDMEDRPACDRYELLKQLTELDSKYRKAWETYDSYKPGSPQQEESSDASRQPSAIKSISAARKYLSENKKKLATIEEPEQREAILNKMQERVSLIISSGEGFDETYQRELESLGLIFTA